MVSKCLLIFSGGYDGKPDHQQKNLNNFTLVKAAQKAASKFYGDSLFDLFKPGLKTKISKFMDVRNINFIDMTKKRGGTAAKIESREALLALLKKSGLKGLSGSNYETAAKLECIKEAGATFIVNGVECDPGLVHDSWIYNSLFDEVAEGIALLDKIFDFKRIVLATKETPAKNSDLFEQVKVKAKFPAGYEKFLVKELLGISLENGRLPVQEGILVLNIQTVLAIASLASGKSSFSCRYLTFADFANARACVVKADFGTSVKAIAEKLSSIQVENFYCGSGALTCHEAAEDEVVSSATCFIGAGQMPDYESAKKCLGCGMCSKKCPAKVNVRAIARSAEKYGINDSGKFSAFNAGECIGCGACSYFCAAGKDLRSLVRQVKELYN